MEKASDYHRDIYSGMVAHELGKNGYFGEEYRIYGFGYWDKGRLKVEADWDEERCAGIYIERWHEGYWLSEQTNCGFRCFEACDLENVFQQLSNTLYISLLERASPLWEEKINYYNKIPIDLLAQDKIKAYISSLSAQQIELKSQGLQMLLGEALRQRKLTEFEYNNLKGMIPILPASQEKTRSISGFAYQEQKEWKFYHNGYLPTVIKKWTDRQKKGSCCSGIISKSYGLNSGRVEYLREDFQKEIRKIFDLTFLKLLSELFS